MEMDQWEKHFLIMKGRPEKNFNVVMLRKFNLHLSPLWKSQTWSYVKRWVWVSSKITVEKNLWNFRTTKDLMLTVNSRNASDTFSLAETFRWRPWWTDWSLYTRKKCLNYRMNLLSKKSLWNERSIMILNQGLRWKVLETILSTLTETESSAVRFFCLELNL